jgi:hypothetical protein
VVAAKTATVAAIVAGVLIATNLILSYWLPEAAGETEEPTQPTKH